MSIRSAALGLLLVFTLAPREALAQSLCVECRAPDRTYSCSVKDSERVRNVRGVSKGLEFLCVSEIARSRQHETCRVGTTYAGPCIGEPLEIDVARLGSQLPAVAAPEGAAPPVGQPAPGAPLPQPAKSEPPKTLEELARNTVTKSKEQLDAADQSVRKAGDAVGGTLKRTWDCMVSLFSRC
jgi:hypothetical protein